MNTLTAHLCAPPPGRLCEGPVWDSRTQELLWVDIRGGHIHCAMLTGPTPDLIPHVTRTLTPPVSAVLPCASGRLLATAGDTIVRIDGSPDSIRPVVKVPFPDDGVRRRFNDAKVDPRGRLLAGTMAESTGGTGSAQLYRLDPDGTLTTLRTGITISNGLGWSPDGRTLYHADSPTHRVDVFEYDLDTGTLGEGKPFAHFPDGEPDGLTVDAEGNVWVAVWGAGQVRAFDPSGNPCATVDVGPSQVSSCTFAGPDLDVLVITTAAEDEAAGEPHAGRLFACRPGVTGLPATLFADERLVVANGR
ncbi:SMP-30/gluconolactonase/LRE family protein [Nocardia sp. CDC153]|uniref:SMP-30/gluconolactonase/LRE family protein n=1 Tax=Nocardia sp. CDC153 TaxID=3112167 RepID=UPI002DB7FDFF|nr:SMP-30/gluconolactonase/LRE family protein [Nocardia sp. CDC153]MEC3952967.1 SMP-30/gluconolactonase/LRE family protein [Nocardia sp. CDC153]